MDKSEGLKGGRIDLIWLGAEEPAPAWTLGRVFCVPYGVGQVGALVSEKLDMEKSAFWLFWDSRMGPPDESTVLEVSRSRGDLWHAGLILGTAGLPGLLDFVYPTWMFNRDPDPEMEATSWRLSLRAALIPTKVLKKMGGPRLSFSSLDGAALEMGHRYISRGVLIRHTPRLVETGVRYLRRGGNSPGLRLIRLPVEDEIRFLYHRVGRAWTCWAVWRAAVSGYIPPIMALKCLRRVLRERTDPEPPPYHDGDPWRQESVNNPRVSVLIPTVERYSYLRTVLCQLREQTVRPYEVIVVDQTPVEMREKGFYDQFRNLPIKVIYRKTVGQCSSRNAGLREATGEYILFLDDDVEIEPDLIEKHLKSLVYFGADVSSGVAEEVGAGPLPSNFRIVKSSDVFPTNNTLIKHGVLRRSGLFDLAYERGQRADGDLGMRVYLSGALMVLNPQISVFHHHAPRGGLRKHKARVITYASSRKYITHRHLPSTTEIYLAKRYFSPRQVRESLWLRLIGTFSLKGPWRRRALKVIFSGAVLPHTLWVIRRRCRQAEKWLETGFPKIPRLDEEQRQVWAK